MTSTTAPFQPNTSRLWFGDFAFGLRGVTVRKTGVVVPYSPSVLAEVSAWFKFFFAAQSAQPIGAPFKIAFAPEPARPWYLIWATTRLAGARIVKDPANADVVMHFEDATFSPNLPPDSARTNAKLVNFRCTDVSKSKVAELNQGVFGRSLRVDPSQHHGQAVEKSEINGAHDGRIVNCPIEAQPGRVYQRLVDNRGPNLDVVDDLRTVVVGARPVVVFIKRRPVTKRFQNTNSEVLLRMPEEVFSAEEIERVSAFADGLGLDCGGLDVLRERSDGTLYIVDANKTDMGPPIALPISEKMQATRLLATAFRKFALERAC